MNKKTREDLNKEIQLHQDVAWLKQILFNHPDFEAPAKDHPLFRNLRKEREMDEAREKLQSEFSHLSKEQLEELLRAKR